MTGGHSFSPDRAVRREQVRVWSVIHTARHVATGAIESDRTSRSFTARCPVQQCCTPRSLRSSSRPLTGTCRTIAIRQSLVVLPTQREAAAMSAATHVSRWCTAASLVKGFTSSHYDSVTPLLPPLCLSLSCVLLFSHPPPFSSYCEPSVR